MTSQNMPLFTLNPKSWRYVPRLGSAVQRARVGNRYLAHVCGHFELNLSIGAPVRSFPLKEKKHVAVFARNGRVLFTVFYKIVWRCCKQGTLHQQVLDVCLHVYPPCPITSTKSPNTSRTRGGCIPYLINTCASGVSRPFP